MADFQYTPQRHAEADPVLDLAEAITNLNGASLRSHAQRRRVRADTVHGAHSRRDPQVQHAAAERRVPRVGVHAAARL